MKAITKMCEGCAGYVDNWFYLHQWYCTLPDEFELKPLSLLIIFIFLICSWLLISRTKKKLQKESKKQEGDKE